MTALFERLRPRAYTDVIGQDKAIAVIDRLRAHGLGGRAYWLAGASGTGKTTLARILASELADDLATIELDANSLTTSEIQGIERESQYTALGTKRGRAYIVNEAHGLRSAAVRQLLVTLERVPEHVLWAFTTTTEGELSLFEMDDAHPLLSRCVQLPLSRQGLAQPFAAYLQSVAQREGLDGAPLAKYLRLIQDNHNNLRAALQAVEAGAML